MSIINTEKGFLNIPSILKKAYIKGIRLGLDDRTLIRSLIVLHRYLNKVSWVKDTEALMCAAFYIADRFAINYPSSFKVEDFGKLFDIKPSSVKWYVEKIIKRLNIITIRDFKGHSYYLDPESFEFKLIESLSKKILEENKIKELVGIMSIDIDMLADHIADYVTSTRIISSVFKYSLRGIIYKILCGK